MQKHTRENWIQYLLPWTDNDQIWGKIDAVKFILVAFYSSGPFSTFNLISTASWREAFLFCVTQKRFALVLLGVKKSPLLRLSMNIYVIEWMASVKLQMTIDTQQDVF